MEGWMPPHPLPTTLACHCSPRYHTAGPSTVNTFFQTSLPHPSRPHLPHLPHLWRLVGHLDAVLQDINGELGAGIAGHPEAEVGVRLVRLQLLADLKVWGWCVKEWFVWGGA